MGLRIFGTDPETQPKPRQSFADDVVGRFRSGYQLNNRPAALSEWRITTGDPDVAKELHDLLGGDAPQEWDSKGEDNIELFSSSPAVEILMDGPKALRQRMVLWGRNGKLIQSGDGETLDYPEDKKGQPDPDAELTFQERKKRGQDGIGPVPQIEVYFRLAANPDLGIFKFQTGSWSLAQDLVRDDVEGDLEDYTADSETGTVKGVLALEEVSFVAKNGPRAGQTVQYTKPVLKIKGAA
ncbi:holin [Arthrobacter phage SWEP2]|uniref:Holin n=1 Tax=Arthrobacter phage SWEP2 TaxID=2945958 RepID=A0A9E7MJ06_9CAUD|nr:holin [Arthrobacter phage SWEP2]